MQTELVIDLLGLGFLLLLSGFFAGAEAALFSLPRLTLKKMKDAGEQIAETIHWLLEDPRKLLITILFCNLLVNTLLSSLTTVTALLLAREFAWNPASTITIATAILSYLLIVVSEVTPINLALNHTEFFSRLVARPIRWISFLLTRVLPIQPLLTWVTDRFIPIFGGQVDGRQPFITHAELYSTITMSAHDGVLEASEKEMIRSIFDFGATQVKEIMTPRVDMIAVAADQRVTDVIRVFREEGFNRLPVYEDNVDNVIGIVHIKDLLPLLGDPEKQAQTRIGQFMWEPFFVPETKKISDLLREFQDRKVQMAIVIDEYGGTEGCVTMEDVLEEIFGDIQDEYDDDEEESVQEQADGTYVLDARMPIDDFNEMFGVQIPHEGFETLGGLVMDLLDGMPEPGAEACLDDLRFVIRGVDGNRIIDLSMNRVPLPAGDEAGDGGKA